MKTEPSPFRHVGIEDYLQWKGRNFAFTSGQYIEVRVRDDPNDATRFIGAGWDAITGHQLFAVHGRRGDQLGDFLELLAIRTQGLANVSLWMNFVEAAYRPGATPFNPGPVDGGSPSPGDPNPKGILRMPTSITVGTNFSFIAHEYDQLTYNLTNLIYHFMVYDLTGGPAAPTVAFTLPAPTGMSAQYPLGNVLSGAGAYQEIYLVPNSPQTLLSGGSINTTITDVRALNAGQAQIGFSLLSDQYQADAWFVSPTITVS